MNQLSINEKLRMEEKCMEEFILKASALREAANAVTKSVKVCINAEDIRDLKNSGYRMCFAKKVGTESYNVVWQSYVDFSENNTFSWRPEYQVFRTDKFQAGVTVEVSSDAKNIGLGEKTIIDKYGILSDPVTGGDSASINVDNEYKATHIGVCQLSTGIDGKTISTPIYVSENQCMVGNAVLKPVEKVMIWFESNTETSTMFSDMKTVGIEVDLTTTNNISVKYESGKWFRI